MKKLKYGAATLIGGMITFPIQCSRNGLNFRLGPKFGPFFKFWPQKSKIGPKNGGEVRIWSDFLNNSKPGQNF